MVFMLSVTCQNCLLFSCLFNGHFLLCRCLNTLAANVSGIAVSAGLNSTNCPPKTKSKKKDQTHIKDFAPHCSNAMLAAALLMSTSGHHEKMKRTFSLPVNEARNCQTKEKPLRGNALSFCFKSFI